MGLVANHPRKVLLFKDLGEEAQNGKALEKETRSRRSQPEGKRAVTKVPSLLFDIELEDGSVEESGVDEDFQEVVQHLKSLVEPWNPAEEKLQQQVRKACADAASEGIKLDAHRLAEKMDLPGYSFRVRTALGGGWGGDCLRQLRHFFLTCVVSGSTGPVRYVIDPCFQEQFEIANPTPRYTAILSEVPHEFVGTEERVAALVGLLSNEIKRSFQATGNTLPPWRHPASMLSKWRPRRSEDIAVTPATGTLEEPATPLFKPLSVTKAAPDSKPLAPAPRQVDIRASASLLSDVARTIAETGGSRQLGVPAAKSSPKASPALDISASQERNKRGRDPPCGSKCSTLLAPKLRGVSSFGPSSPFPSLCSNKSQA